MNPGKKCFAVLQMLTVFSIVAVLFALVFPIRSSENSAVASVLIGKKPRAKGVLKGEVDISQLNLTFIKDAASGAAGKFVDLDVPKTILPFEFDLSSASDDEFTVTDEFTYQGAEIKVELTVRPPEDQLDGSNELKFATEVLKIVGPMILGGDSKSAELTDNEGTLKVTFMNKSSDFNRAIIDMVGAVKIFPIMSAE